MLEIVNIMDWSVEDLLLHHTPHFIVNRIQICSDAILWEEWHLVCGRLWIRGLSNRQCCCPMAPEPQGLRASRRRAFWTSLIQ